MMQFASTRLVSKDVLKLAAFYQLVSQVEPVGGEDFVELRLPGATLAIASERGVRQANGGAARAGTNRSMILEFQVEDVDVERTRLAEVVEHWVQEPTNQPWGNRSMLFRDPDGNLINLFTPLPVPSGVTAPTVTSI